jgi:hypothetical protein
MFIIDHPLHLNIFHLRHFKILRLFLTCSNFVLKFLCSNHINMIHFYTIVLTSFTRWLRGHCGRDCMVVGCTTTYAISAYHHWCCEFESRSRRGVQHYVITIVSDLRQVGGFHWVLRFPPPIKLTATIYSWVWPAVLMLPCCLMAMGLYECGWLSLGWHFA